MLVNIRNSRVSHILYHIVQIWHVERCLETYFPTTYELNPLLFVTLITKVYLFTYEL